MQQPLDKNSRKASKSPIRMFHAQCGQDFSRLVDERKEEGVSWFISASPDAIRRWKGPAIADNQIDKLAFQPSVQSLASLGLTEQPICENYLYLIINRKKICRLLRHQANDFLPKYFQLYKKIYISYHKCELGTQISTMKYKSVSNQSGELLFYFNEQGKNCFNYADVFQALPDSKEESVRKLLSDMTKRGLLMRLKNGVYFIIPYEGDAELFVPEWHSVVHCLVAGIEHYIGYYSALQIHGFITQPSLKEQIVVKQQIRPSEIKVKNVPFQFIYHNEKHYFGERKIWIDSFTKVSCSDLEKTFVDCLFKPEYAGGIVEIAKAIYGSRHKIKWNKLLDYTFKFNSQAVIKRLGFLLETLGIGQEITDELQQIKSSSYIVLDTELPKNGKRLSRWRIQQNLETETIKSAIYT